MIEFKTISLSNEHSLHGLFPTKGIKSTVNSLLEVWQDHPTLAVVVAASAIALVAGIVAIVMSSQDKGNDEPER